KSALQEIGNIGMGNATRSLAFILEDSLKLDLPVVKFLDMDNLSDFIAGQEENIVLSAFCSITGDINGTVMLLIQKDFVMKILHKVFPADEIINEDSFSEIQLSAIDEMCNIFIGSYTTAIATFLDIDAKISLPNICFDMLGAILSSVAVEIYTYHDKFLVINNYIESDTANAFDMYYLPDEESYKKIITKLGI
ncbi:MAG: chemotaxis protein CheC, partial [Oscillospiraceae bacterium]